MFLHEAWSWKSFAPNYPARKTSAGTESSLRESRRCRKIVKTQGPRFLGATINIYQLCLDTFHGHVFVFSSFFFFPLFFVVRSTNDYVLCGDLLLGKSKRKRKEETRALFRASARNGRNWKIEKEEKNGVW